MKAAYIEKPGPPENIIYGDLPEPIPAASQVLVKVVAVALDPVDAYIRSGAYPIDLPFPFIVGRDMVGVVEEGGSEAQRFSPGARVWCNNQGYRGRQGTFAEYLSIDQELLYPLPEGVDEKQAVAVLHSATTASIGLLREAQLREGESVFVNGGAGNVGAAVLQIAANMGARVIVTAGSDSDLEYCRELGAERAVSYRTDYVTAISEFAPKGVDVYWDTTTTPDFERAMPLLAHRGRIILMAGLNAHPTFPVGALYTKDCSVRGFAITNATVNELRQCADSINQWLAEGKLKARIAREMGLADAAQAHRIFEDSQHGSLKLSGKIVLTA
ncbi:MAG TPA: NADPH:quinone reductase [Candidatus Binataceae bacterium]|nr:NADPH:quinone reductase [Candidatus Binataceae bacterium]